MSVLSLRLSAIDDVRLRIFAESVDGEAETDSSLPYEGDQRALITVAKILESNSFRFADFQREAEQDWMTGHGLLSDDGAHFAADALFRIGEVMHRCLFPPGSRVLELLSMALAGAEKANAMLHVQLQLSGDVDAAAPVHVYPWELVHDGRDFLARRQVCFSRYIAYMGAPPNLAPTKQLRVLLVSSAASSPDDGLQALPGNEREAIREALQQAERAGHISLKNLELATMQALRSYLNHADVQQLPHVLHFDGHGAYGRVCHYPKADGQLCNTFNRGRAKDRCRRCDAPLPLEREGYLLFETDDGGPHYVPAREFGRALNKAGLGKGDTTMGLACVVLSACRSALTLGDDSVFQGVAQSLIGHRVPAAVAMRQRIRVDAAADFARGFYEALATRRPLADAVALGRDALPDDQWYRPVLYLRWRDNVGGQLFTADMGEISSQSWLRACAESTSQKLTQHLAAIHGLEAEDADVAYIETVVRRQKIDDSNLAAAAFSVAALLEKGPCTTLLAGAPGCGKTSALLHLAAVAAARAVENTKAPIPVYVRLNRIDTDERVLDRLFELIAREWGTELAVVENLWREERRPLLILLDAFNEVTEDRRDGCRIALEELTERIQHYYVVTTRTGSEAEFALDNGVPVEALEMLPLNEIQLRSELRRRGQGNLFPRIPRAVRDLAANPYLLSLLLESLTEEQVAQAEIPPNLGRLHASFVDDYIFGRREPRKRPSTTRYDYRRIKRPLLGSLAKYMIERGEVRTDWSGPIEDQMLQQLEKLAEGGRGRRHSLVPPPDERSVEDFFDECEQNGLLRLGADSIEFNHQSTRDYFAAAFLHDTQATVDDVVGLLPVSDPNLEKSPRGAFADAVVLYSGLSNDSSSLVKGLLDRNLLVACECFAGRAQVQSAVDATLVEYLLNCLKSDNPNRNIEGMAGIASAALDRPELQDALTSRLMAGDQLLAANAALSLSRLLGRRALLPLFTTILNHQDTVVRMISATVLNHALGVEDDLLVSNGMTYMALQGDKERVLPSVGGVEAIEVARRSLALLTDGVTVEELVEEILRPGAVDLDREAATLALRLALHDEGLRQLKEIVSDRNADDERRCFAIRAVSRMGYKALEARVLAEPLQHDDESDGLRVYAASGLCVTVFQHYVAHGQEEEQPLPAPGLEVLAKVARDPAVASIVRAQAAQGLVCSWRDEDFQTFVELVADPKQNQQFRGEALRMLARHLGNPLPDWLTQFSKRQEVRALLWRDGVGDEEMGKRWTAVCDLVVRRILAEDEEVSEAMRGAVACLAEIPGALQYCYQLALDDTAETIMRRNAIKCLVGLEPQHGNAALLQVVLDVEDESIRKFAVGGAAAGEPDIIKVLQKFRDDEESDLVRRENAVIAMLKLPDIEANGQLEYGKKLEGTITAAVISYALHAWAELVQGGQLMRGTPQSNRARAGYYAGVNSNDERIIKIIETAMQDDPDNLQWLQSLCYQYMLGKDWERALTVADQGLQLDQSDIYLLESAAQIELWRGFYKEAKVRLKAWAEHAGPSPEIEERLALTSFRLRQFEEALAHYQQAAQLDAKTPTRLVGVYGALLKLHRYDETEALKPTIAKLSADLDDLQIAWIEALSGNDESALKHLAEAIANERCRRIDLDDPGFDSVRHHDRFEALLSSVAVQPE